ncbi:MAG: glycosyltransferase family 2 protein, partial [Solirubrobacteraceae bacterium]
MRSVGREKALGGGADGAVVAMLVGVVATIAGTCLALRADRTRAIDPPVRSPTGDPGEALPSAKREQQALSPLIAGATHPLGETPVADRDAALDGGVTGPGISVVVATRDRPAALESCLLALSRQSVALEIVVVDDGSADARAVAGAVRLGAPDARVVTGAGRGPAAARNLGARAARGAIVCFTDDDCLPDRRWAERLAAACAERCAAAGTTVADPAAGRAAAASQVITHTLQIASLNRAAGLLGFAPTCNLACHAEILRAVPFDESFPLAAGEDRDWCARVAGAGVGLRFVPEAIVAHGPPIGTLGLLRQQARYGRGAVRFRAVAGQRRLSGRAFYRRLARAAAREGPAVTALVLLAQAAGAAGAACEV